MTEAVRDASLSIDGLVAGYDRGVVIDRLSFDVASGEPVGLMGLNGAGKTTLLKAIMGLIPASAGAIRFGGERIDGRPPFAIARRGVAYVPQGRAIFADLSVEENLRLGDVGHARPDKSYALFPALGARRKERAGRLSGGQQQQLALARALIARPRLLLLDEPSEGVQPSIIAEIAALLSRVTGDGGVGLVLVEQNLELILAVTSRVAFVQHGRVAAEEPTARLRAEPQLVEARMGL